MAPQGAGADQPDADIDADALTNADLLALLARDGMGGFGGVSKSEFYELSYREIFESYFAEFDDNYRLVPLRRRYERMRALLGAIDGDAGESERRPLTDEELAIPSAVMTCGVPLDFVRLWWTIWRRRNLFTTEQLEEKWWQEMRQTPPKNFRDPQKG